MPDNIHMLLSIPPKYSVSSFMGYLKGKSAMMIFEKHGNLKYYFDVETGFYYLQSRYYDPIVGRFINGDAPDILELLTLVYDVLGINLFAYCMNNPILCSDPSGHYGWWDFYRARWFVAGVINTVISFLVGGALGAVSKFFKNLAAKYTAKRAAVLFPQDLLKSLLKKIAASIANWAAKAVLALCTVLTWALDPGTAIFDWVDARDKKPRSGYLDF